MKVLLILLSVLAAGRGTAQALKIGDQVPEIYLNTIVNDSRTNGKLSEFRKKLTIIDFWGTGCSACIDKFPSLNQLQTRFKNDLQVLLVNPESADSLAKFLRKHKTVKLPAVPCIPGDTSLHQLFPHSFVPFQVWLDSTGKVFQLVEASNATPENISAYLAGKELNLVQVKYAQRFWVKSLWSYSNQLPPATHMAYSIITGYIPNLQLRNGILSPEYGDSFSGISCGNVPIVSLFIMAFEEGSKHKFLPNLIEIRHADSLRISAPSDQNLMSQWGIDNYYCYESALPGSRAPQLYKKMQDDLVAFFGIKARIEKQSRECWVLIEQERSKFPISKKQKTRTNLWRASEDTVKFAEAYPFDGFGNIAKIIVENSTSIPFRDETKFEGKVDFSFPTSILENFDLSAYRKILRSYGLDLVKRRRDVEVLILE